MITVHRTVGIPCACEDQGVVVADAGYVSSDKDALLQAVAAGEFCAPERELSVA